MRKSKKAKGFTLIELIIVIVIISILALVSVPIYRGYTRRAMASEGRALVGSVANAEKIFLAEHGTYLAVADTGYDADLDVDSRGNTYFRTYSVAVAGSVAGANANFVVRSAGVGDAAGMTVIYTQPWNAAPTVQVQGL